MATLNTLLAGVEQWRETASADNGAATATHAAVTNKRHFVSGFSISASAAFAGLKTAKIRQNGGATTRREFQIPAAAFAPIIYEFKRPLEIPRGEDVDITLDASGTAGVVGRVEIVGFTGD